MEFRVNHLHLKAPDARRTAQWYTEFVGAQIVTEGNDLGGESFRLDLHGVPLRVTGFLDEQELQQHYGLEHVAIDAQDFDGAVNKIKGSGAKILEERVLADGRRVCFFEGPEGVRLEFLEILK